MAVLEGDASGAVRERRLRGGHASHAAGKLVQGRQDQARGGDQEAAAELERGLAGAVATVQHPDVPTPLVLYGESWADGDRVAIPESDFPAGLPAWMHEQDGWAKRIGADDLAKRRNITITVPKGVVT